MTINGVAYSDFDGVHNTPKRSGLRTARVATAGSKFFRAETIIAWDQEMLELFGEFLRVAGFGLVWLTTWNEHSLIKRAAQGMGFPHEEHAPAALNHEAKGSKEWTEWKALHIIADQRENPRPFIWIDDKAPLFWREFVEEHTVAPSLIIATDSHSGLTKADLLRMVDWAESVQAGIDRNAIIGA